MLRKLMTFILIFALATTCMAQSRVTKKELTFYNIFGDEYSSLASVTIQNAGTSTTATLYAERTGTTSLTNPISTGLGDGRIEFWSRDADYKVVAYDGTDTLTVDNLTGSQTRLPFWGEYIGNLSSYNLGQSDDLDFSYGNWIIDGDTSDRLDMIPDSDGGILGIGDATYQADVYIYSSSGDYVYFDESTATLEMVDIDLDLDDDVTLNIGTGDDVAITWNNSGGYLDFNITGILDLDISDDIDIDIAGAAGEDFMVTNTGGSILLSASEDTTDAIDIDATAGGIDIDATGESGQDIVITNTGGSISLVATEAAADAIVLHASTAAGGIDITSNADLDLTTTGAAGEDISITNTGGSINIKATENAAESVFIEADGGANETIYIHADQGTTGTSIYVHSDGGSITVNAGDNLDIDAADNVTLDTADGSMSFTAGGSSNGDVTFTVGDDMTLAVTGSLTLGKRLYQTYITTYAGNASLSSAQSGTIIANTAGGGTQIFQLPSAAAGLIYTIVDLSATAGDDVCIIPSSGDSVGPCNTSNVYVQIGDAFPGCITVFAVNTASWVISNQAGTWANTGL